VTLSCNSYWRNLGAGVNRVLRESRLSALAELRFQTNGNFLLIFEDSF
jgi:hypothetical protein